MPSNEISLNIMCESTDKNGYKTWSVLKEVVVIWNQV